MFWVGADEKEHEAKKKRESPFRQRLPTEWANPESNVHHLLTVY